MRKMFPMMLCTALVAGCGTMKPFEKMDRNADGAIDREEAAVTPQVAEMFSTADDDDSETLDAGEYASVLQVIDQYRQTTPRRSGGGGNVDVGH